MSSRSDGISVYILEEVERDVVNGNLSNNSSNIYDNEESRVRTRQRSNSIKKTNAHAFSFEVLSSIPTIRVKDPKDYKNRDPSSSSILICTRQSFLDLISEDSSHFDKNLVEKLNMVVVSSVHEALTSMSARKNLQKILDEIR